MKKDLSNRKILPISIKYQDSAMGLNIMTHTSWDWTEVVHIAKSLGFEWGGDWTQFKDYPHLQMDFGLTIADLQNGERPDESSLVADTR